MRANESSQLKMSLDPQPGSEPKLAGGLLQAAAVGSAHDAPAVALAPAAEVASAVGPALVAVPTDFAMRPAAQVLDARTWTRMRLFVDAVVLCLASTVAMLPSVLGGRPDPWLGAAFSLLALGLLYAGRKPDDRLHASAVDAVAHALWAILLAAVLTVAAGSILGHAHPVALAVRLWWFASVSVALALIALLSYRSHAVSNHALAKPTLIVGAGVVGTHVARRLLADPRYGLFPVGFLDTAPMPNYDRSRAPSVPVLGGPSALPEAVARSGARHVILAFTSEPDHVLVQKVRECQELGIEVSLVPRLYEAINQRVTVDHIGGLPLLSLRRTNPRGWQFAVKHAFDRAFALIALIMLAPVMIAVATAVRMTSPGPVLFRQRRVGRDGRTFDLLKFRTMLEVDSTREFTPPEGCAPGGIEGDDRRTSIGAWLRGTSLDELPQLINVLCGEMSLVGPRPERPEFVERFDVEVDHYRDRHRVKSGITGWAQVNGLRGQTSIADRVEWDNYYIENWSLSLDLRIIVLTVAEVLQLRDSDPAAEQ
jgi:exopolysaccharide biosynthesis polyprenyl glycosylphosphotransferase